MRVLWVALAIALADQVTKIAVRSNMEYRESIPIIGNWFRFTYTENPGMAFGLDPGSKLFLTLFSILATVLIGVYLYMVRHATVGYRVSLALILGGAVGNIIDRTFYGVIFGYGPIFYGNVVDFLHLDVWQGIIPAGVPFIGGSYFGLFPIGNIADVAIIAGVVMVIVTQHRAEKAMAREAELNAESTGETGEVGAPASFEQEPASGSALAAEPQERPIESDFSPEGPSRTS